MKSPLIFALVSLIVIAGIGYIATSQNNTQSTNNIRTENNDESNSPVVTPQTPGTAGSYTKYDPEMIEQSDAEHIVLFFHATWCPSCRALDNDITANLENIPTNVAIYKVDYDTATDLKRKYSITTQHSLIEIESDGTAVSSVTHPLTLQDLLAIL